MSPLPNYWSLLSYCNQSVRDTESPALPKRRIQKQHIQLFYSTLIIEMYLYNDNTSRQEQCNEETFKAVQASRNSMPCTFERDRQAAVAKTAHANHSLQLWRSIKTRKELKLWKESDCPRLVHEPVPGQTVNSACSAWAWGPPSGCVVLTSCLVRRAGTAVSILVSNKQFKNSRK